MTERTIISRKLNRCGLFLNIINYIALAISVYVGVKKGIGCYELNVKVFLLCFLIVYLPVLAVVIVMYFAFSKIKIIVTDKRIHGYSTFGKKIDLPLESVSAVSQYNFGLGIKIKTSNKTIRFAAVTDSREIYHDIRNLISKR